MIVSRQDLEQSLARVRASVVNPDHGIHGPGSKVWELNRELILFVGGGRAALMQLAHPHVAHAIDQHSKTREDTLGRFNRTFTNVFAMTWGTLDRAFKAARGVHNIHSRITGVITEDVGGFRVGDPYHANDVDSLMWVYATLMHTVIDVLELFVRPISAAEKDDYYQGTKSFAYLFGITDDTLPADWAAFDAYFRRTLADECTIAAGEPAREMGHFLFVPPQPSHGPAMAWFKIMTAGLLTPRLRDEFGLRWSLRDRAVFRASVRAIGPIYRALPASARYLPEYVTAERRCRGLGPTRISQLVERVLMYGVGGKKALARAA